ncbi:PfkB family carbohydrate kinase [Actinocorallia sp. B10E7]|uniref:PfkB family carbohydrate kinase n=1 Tax=Actinocorallia sp. B10E7 TaxID=3153558 RepID=UPI00325DC7DD
MRAGPLVVVGDTLLDVDLQGTSERLAPNAPVPVVDLAAERPRPGGAGLAAGQAARLASAREVVLVTALADTDDPDALTLLDLLEGQGVRVVRLALTGRTVRKTRLMTYGRPLVRVDRGDGRLHGRTGLPDAAAEAVREAGAVLVSDYGRGVAAHPVLRALLEVLPAEAPVVWDPHPRGAVPVRGARLVTPNRQEARVLAATAPTARPGGYAQAATDAAALRSRWRAAGVGVTLGEHGVLLSTGDQPPVLVPAPHVPGQPDTCGAGDCFAAAAAVSLAEGALLTEAVEQGVHHASVFVTGAPAGRRENVPADDPWELVRRARLQGGTVVATGGCFDLLHPGHISLLHQAARLGDLLVVCLNSDASVRALKGPGRPVMGQRDRIRVLSALGCVDAVMAFDEETPMALLERLRPDLWVKGGDYGPMELPEAPLVRRHGGQVLLLPYLEGRSTTHLVRRAHAAGGEHA